MRLRLVSVKLKNSIYSDTSIAASFDAALFLQKTLNGVIKENTMYALDLNVRSKVQSMHVMNYNDFEKNPNILLAGNILSNSSGVILASVGSSPEKEKMIKRFADNATLCGIRCIDHVCFNDDEMHSLGFSYRSNEVMDFDDPFPESISASRKVIGKKQVADDVIKIKLSTEKYLGTDIKTKEDAMELIAKELAYKDREYIACISLDQENKPINASYASIGSINQALFYPSDVFKVPLLSGANSVVFMHNHPSGDTTASAADISSAARMINVGRIFGIDVENYVVSGLKGEIEKIEVENSNKMQAVKLTKVEEINYMDNNAIEKVYMNVYRSYAMLDVPRKDGKGTYNVVKMPSGVSVNGQDISYGKIYPYDGYVYPNKFNDNLVTVQMKPDQIMQINLPDGSFVTATGTELVSAVDKANKEYLHEISTRDNSQEQGKDKSFQFGKNKRKDDGIEL